MGTSPEMKMICLRKTEIKKNGKIEEFKKGDSKMMRLSAAKSHLLEGDWELGPRQTPKAIKRWEVRFQDE